MQHLSDRSAHDYGLFAIIFGTTAHWQNIWRCTEQHADKKILARIWDGAIGIEIATLRHRKSLSSAAFSSDGARIVTTSSPWFSPTGSQIIRTGDVIACLWNISPTVSGEHSVSTISPQQLRRFTKVIGEEMQLTGYLDTVAEIDIARA